MKLTELICYTLLTITVTANYAQGEIKKNELSDDKIDKRIRKRETALLIDNYVPASSMKQQPRMVYRRISKQRYRKQKPNNYGPQRLNYYSSTAPNRKPAQKYRKKQINQSYSSSKSKYPGTKPRHGPHGSSYNMKPIYSLPQTVPEYTHHMLEPAGFGEPPSEHSLQFQTPKTSFVHTYEYPKKDTKPLVDSYGSPLSHQYATSYPSTHKFPPTLEHVENHGILPSTSSNFDVQDNKFELETQFWKNFQRNKHNIPLDSNYEFSKKHTKYIPFDPAGHNNMSPMGNDEGFPLTSYSDVYKYIEGNDAKHSLFEGKTKLYGDKYLNKPWKSQKHKSADPVLVGGQYAEPPARYMSKFQPSEPLSPDSDSFAPIGFADVEKDGTATVSSYVNYKNSNMAFSPQNLNDVFSISNR